ncbi:MAG: hypothetical protein RJA13_963 [Bacteroidota bacterium]
MAQKHTREKAPHRLFANRYAQLLETISLRTKIIV